MLSKGKGALARCTSIDLSGNPANDEAKKSVERALKDRWLDGDFLVKNLSDVESLPCYGLGWGDAEIIKLASAIEYACANGALPALKALNLVSNAIGDVGVQALAGAVSNGALSKCTYIGINGNPASKEAQQAVKDALKQR